MVNEPVNFSNINLESDEGDTFETLALVELESHISGWDQKTQWTLERAANIVFETPAGSASVPVRPGTPSMVPE